MEPSIKSCVCLAGVVVNRGAGVLRSTYDWSCTCIQTRHEHVVITHTGERKGEDKCISYMLIEFGNRAVMYVTEPFI